MQAPASTTDDVPPSSPEHPKATDDVPPSSPEYPKPEVPAVPEIVPPPKIGPEPVKPKRKLTLRPKECRCLLSQVNHMQRSQESQIAVAELFSEPRVTLEAQRHATGLAFDIKQGCDLVDPATLKEVSDLLESANPRLLTASPPCTHWGGWEHLNRCYRTALERARVVRRVRQQLRFCVSELHAQIRRDGKWLFEHPEMRSLIRKYGFHKIDMCAFGLRCPKNHNPIRKRTGIVCSDPEFAKVVRTCPGNHEHQQNEGSINAHTTRCAFSAQYTQEFVRTLWECLGPESSAVLHVQSPPVDWVSLNCECLAARREPANPEAEPAPEAAEPPENPETNRKVDAALKKLHANLGHPSSRELIRVLRHSGASAHAIERANKLQCSICANHQRPSAPLPANTDRAREFNDRVGLDVKHVQGWQAGHKQVCVNIVDYATSFQVMVPIGRRETGELLRAAFRDKWLSFAGPPKTLVLDPGRPNLGTVFNDFCEQQGIAVEQTAAESHWQLAKVELHGQWFSRILDRIIDEVRPLDEEEHNTCIVQAQSAKNAPIS